MINWNILLLIYNLREIKKRIFISKISIIYSTIDVIWEQIKYQAKLVKINLFHNKILGK